MSEFESVFSFSTALMAGGHSKRLGQDKVILSLPGTGRLLWQRQWQILAELQPGYLLWSGQPRTGLPADCHIVPDVFPNAGPLAGISACLDFISTDLLLVMAVDLPQMNGTFLRRLLAHCSRESGVVARRGDFFEPLVAVYPKSLARLARQHLVEGRHALQDFVRAAKEQNAVKIILVEKQEEPLFYNLNLPSDLEELRKA